MLRCFIDRSGALASRMHRKLRELLYLVWNNDVTACSINDDFQGITSTHTIIDVVVNPSKCVSGLSYALFNWNSKAPHPLTPHLTRSHVQAIRGHVLKCGKFNLRVTTRRRSSAAGSRGKVVSPSGEHMKNFFSFFNSSSYLDSYHAAGF